jgi:hypothetical protein
VQTFRPRTQPAEAVLIDSRRWTARVIAPRAGAVRAAGDRLLVYDGRHPIGGPRRGAGLQVFDRSGDLEYVVLRGERVRANAGEVCAWSTCAAAASSRAIPAGGATSI